MKREARVSEWIADTNMDFTHNYVFIDEAGFNMHLRRNFGRSKKGIPAKIIVPSIRGISITILGAICEIGIIDLTLRKPKAVPKPKKRKLDSTDKAVEEANGRVGTRTEHYIQFIKGLMNTLCASDMKGIYTDV